MIVTDSLTDGLTDRLTNFYETISSFFNLYQLISTSTDFCQSKSTWFNLTLIGHNYHYNSRPLLTNPYEWAKNKGNDMKLSEYDLKICFNGIRLDHIRSYEIRYNQKILGDIRWERMRSNEINRIRWVQMSLYEMRCDKLRLDELEWDQMWSNAIWSEHAITDAIRVYCMRWNKIRCNCIRWDQLELDWIKLNPRRLDVIRWDKMKRDDIRCDWMGSD